MRKIQNLALIKAVEITDGLEQYNKDNDTARARLVFAYDNSEENGDDDVLALLTSMTNTNQYSIIVNLEGMPGVEGKTVDQMLVIARQLLVGKKTTFTTYVFPIAELNEQGETRVHKRKLSRYTQWIW